MGRRVEASVATSAWNMITLTRTCQQSITKQNTIKHCIGAPCGNKIKWEQETAGITILIAGVWTTHLLTMLLHAGAPWVSSIGAPWVSSIGATRKCHKCVVQGVHHRHARRRLHRLDATTGPSEG